MVKNPPASARDDGGAGSVLRSGRSPGGGTSNPFWHVVWNIPWTEEDDGLHL